MVVTPKKILFVSVIENVGAKERIKIVCMHVLPLIFQFSLILADFFSQHCLIELSNQWCSDIQDMIKRIENVQVFETIYEPCYWPLD